MYIKPCVFFFFIYFIAPGADCYFYTRAWKRTEEADDNNNKSGPSTLSPRRWHIAGFDAITYSNPSSPALLPRSSRAVHTIFFFRFCLLVATAACMYKRLAFVNIILLYILYTWSLNRTHDEKRCHFWCQMLCVQEIIFILYYGL